MLLIKRMDALDQLVAFRQPVEARKVKTRIGEAVVLVGGVAREMRQSPGSVALLNHLAAYGASARPEDDQRHTASLRRV